MAGQVLRTLIKQAEPANKKEIRIFRRFSFFGFIIQRGKSFLQLV